MKKLQIISCLVCLFLIGGSIHAQNPQKNHSIGIQINPYLDSDLFSGILMKPVFAGRFGFNLDNHLSVGPEVSGYLIRFHPNRGDMDITDIKLGGFARYTFMPASRIRPFLEFSPYYTFHHFKSETIFTPEGIGKEYHANLLSGYISPGITLYSKNEKFSLDLMYKFSNKYFLNGHKSVFTYRFSFNF